jgi:hypothetical protein
MRWQAIVALLKAAVGEALTTNWVALLMLLMTVLAAKVPVPAVLYTGIPTRRLAVLLTVTVVPLLLAPVNTGLLTPTINFTNTQAASQLLGPLLVPAVVFWLLVTALLTAMLLANSTEPCPAATMAKMQKRCFIRKCNEGLKTEKARCFGQGVGKMKRPD